MELALDIADRYMMAEPDITYHWCAMKPIFLVSYWIATKFCSGQYETTKAENQALSLEQILKSIPEMSSQTIKQLEMHILNVIDWKVTVPTTVAFVDAFFGYIIAHFTSPFFQHAKATAVRIAEIVTVDNRLARVKRSVIATACIEHAYHLAKVSFRLDAALFYEGATGVELDDSLYHRVYLVIGDLLYPRGRK
ncbi:unknown protein [Seminavis robusta]|uniref:Cyclin C-terminal domain-containing protein n=1 Tax=Seminavis robusta TaxID=568900 RepID=A0A9N8HSF5_9STRA|nr:unknown protein [Seminavis robusta]|eukprot:Sro1714_g293000.1 n/a (194) ;mRNA; f:364-945